MQYYFFFKYLTGKIKILNYHKIHKTIIPTKAIFNKFEIKFINKYNNVFTKQ